MLYDPKWNRWEQPSTKPHPMSVAGLAAWLETQNPTTEYWFCDIHNCLLMQYFKSLGYKRPFGGADGHFYYTRFLWPLWYKSYPREMDQIAVGEPRTFGAALERARSVK